jgi:hypothetical protein
MSIFTDTTSTLMTLVIDNSSLPVIGVNDDGVGKDLKDGFLMADVRFRSNSQVTINGLNPKLRLRGTLDVAICTPVNQGSAAGLAIADTLHGIFSSQRFAHVFCYPGFVDSAYQIQYAKGNYWNTQFLCNFYVEEYI